MKKYLFLLLFALPILAGAQTFNVQSTGIPGTPTATIIPSTASLGTAFTTIQGTPSTSQSFTVSGSLLTAVGTVTAGSGYEVSLNNSSFAGTQNLPVSSGDFTGHPVPIYIRLTGAFAGTFNSFVTITSAGAQTKQVAVSGTVTSNTPTLTVTGSYTAFNTVAGTPSTAQTVTVTGTNLTAGMTVTPPSPLLCSTDGTTYTSPCSVSQSAGGLAGQPVTIYIRVPSSASAGAISGNVAFSSTGATTVNLAATGTVSPPGGANDTLLVNLTDGQSGASMHQTKWNNWSPTVQVTTNQSSGTLNYATGSASPGITLTITQNVSTSSNYYDNTLAYGTGNSLGFPDTTVRMAYGSFDDGPDTLIVNNLPTAANNYTVILVCSRNTGVDRTMNINCNGQTATVNAENNTSTVVRFNNVVKNGSSKIYIIMTPDFTLQTSGNRVIYFNAVEIIKNN